MLLPSSAEKRQQVLSRNVASHTQERTRSFQAFTLGDIQVVVLWIIKPCKRISLFRYFGETCKLHLHNAEKYGYEHVKFLSGL